VSTYSHWHQYSGMEVDYGSTFASMSTDVQIASTACSIMTTKLLSKTRSCNKLKNVVYSGEIDGDSRFQVAYFEHPGSFQRVASPLIRHFSGPL